MGETKVSVGGAWAVGRACGGRGAGSVVGGAWGADLGRAPAGCGQHRCLSPKSRPLLTLLSAARITRQQASTGPTPLSDRETVVRPLELSAHRLWLGEMPGSWAEKSTAQQIRAAVGAPQPAAGSGPLAQACPLAPPLSCAPPPCSLEAALAVLPENHRSAGPPGVSTTDGARILG